MFYCYHSAVSLNMVLYVFMQEKCVEMKLEKEKLEMAVGDTAIIVSTSTTPKVTATIHLTSQLMRNNTPPTSADAPPEAGATTTDTPTETSTTVATAGKSYGISTLLCDEPEERLPSVSFKVYVYFI